MAIHAVNYDLKKPGRNYQSLYDAIGQYKNCHHLESTWLIDTAETPAQVRDKLKQHIDQNDSLFVCRLQNAWATLNYDCASWLKDGSRRW